MNLPWGEIIFGQIQSNLDFVLSAFGRYAAHFSDIEYMLCLELILWYSAVPRFSTQNNTRVFVFLESSTTGCDLLSCKDACQGFGTGIWCTVLMDCLITSCSMVAEISCSSTHLAYMCMLVLWMTCVIGKCAQPVDWNVDLAVQSVVCISCMLSPSLPLLTKVDWNVDLSVLFMVYASCMWSPKPCAR